MKKHYIKTGKISREFFMRNKRPERVVKASNETVWYFLTQSNVFFFLSNCDGYYHVEKCFLFYTIWNFGWFKNERKFFSTNHPETRKENIYEIYLNIKKTFFTRKMFSLFQQKCVFLCRRKFIISARRTQKYYHWRKKNICFHEMLSRKWNISRNKIILW